MVVGAGAAGGCVACTSGARWSSNATALADAAAAATVAEAADSALADAAAAVLRAATLPVLALASTASGGFGQNSTSAAVISMTSVSAEAPPTMSSFGAKRRAGAAGDASVVAGVSAFMPPVSAGGRRP